MEQGYLFNLTVLSHHSRATYSVLQCKYSHHVVTCCVSAEQMRLKSASNNSKLVDISYFVS